MRSWDIANVTSGASMGGRRRVSIERASHGEGFVGGMLERKVGEGGRVWGASLKGAGIPIG